MELFRNAKDEQERTILEDYFIGLLKDTKEILEENPGLSQIFVQYGLPCLVCGEPFWGTIEQLARQHGVDVKDLVNKLNEKRQ